ncbi:hypothetical protein, partial [Mesorhizobium sp.]|uniref:hypothetical protein n=1 Tax=Mesorhizobium sp. TaxID=1871066 RepID=UPI0025B97E14
SKTVMAGGVTAAKRPAFFKKSRRASPSETSFSAFVSVGLVHSFSTLALLPRNDLVAACKDISSPKGAHVATM